MEMLISAVHIASIISSHFLGHLSSQPTPTYEHMQTHTQPPRHTHTHTHNTQRIMFDLQCSALQHHQFSHLSEYWCEHDSEKYIHDHTQKQKHTHTHTHTRTYTHTHTHTFRKQKYIWKTCTIRIKELRN